MKQCMDSDNLHRRLKKIIGQVQAIDRMIDEDIPVKISSRRSMQQSPRSIKRGRLFWKGISNTVSGTGSSTATLTRRSRILRKQ